jgi:uncharacterized protein (UPF0335 family)
MRAVSEAEPGDNAAGLPPPKPRAKNESIGAARLRSIIERIEHLTEERKAIASCIKDIFSEAKSAGFDTKVIRLVLKVRASDRESLDEIEQLRDAYLHAIESGDSTDAADEDSL